MRSCLCYAPGLLKPQRRIWLGPEKLSGSKHEMLIRPCCAGTRTQFEVSNWIYHGRHECSFEIVSGDEGCVVRFDFELIRLVGGSQG